MMNETPRRMLRGLATCIVTALLTVIPLPATSALLASGDVTLAAPAAVKSPGGLVVVVEFYNAALQHYFISADAAEIAVLDGGAFGGAWQRTGETFPAWDIVGAPVGTVPVCRFFGTDRYRADGTRIGANSHFYTADPTECAFVRTAWQSIASDGQSYPAWTFESYAFAVVLPVGGTCPATTQPLYRAYNNGARGDPGHRYSTRPALLQGLAGWAFEGLVMCLPQAAAVVLPSTLTACSTPDCAVGRTAIGSGAGLVTLMVDVTNASSDPIDLDVPAGRTFIAVVPAYQDGLLLEAVHLTIAPGTTRQLLLRLFCMELHRGPAVTGGLYTTAAITDNAQLLDIAGVANGKLGSANDPLGVKVVVVQDAIWEVTSGRGALTAQQRTLLVRMLAAAADDGETQANVLVEFQATLSFAP